MNFQESLKIVSICLGSSFLPFLIFFIILKEYIKEKAAYIFLIILFIAFCINFFICNLDEIIGGISLAVLPWIIFSIILGFIVYLIKKLF